MSRYAIFFVAAAGAFCLGGPPFVQCADIKPIQTIKGGDYSLTDLHLSPDGKRLFYINSGIVTWLDLASGRKVEKRPSLLKLGTEQLSQKRVHIEKDIWFLSLSRPQYKIDADGFKNRFLLYDFGREKIEADWTAHKGAAEAVEFDAKRNRLITAGSFIYDRTVCYWDRKTLKKIAEFDVVKELGLKDEPGNPFQIERVALDPTASFLAFGFREGMIQVRDIATERWHAVSLEGHMITSLRFLDSRTLAVGRREIAAGWLPTALIEHDSLEVYDWKATKVLFRVDCKGFLEGIAVAPNGRLMALGNRDYKHDRSWVRLWDVAAKREVAAFKAYEGEMDKGSIYRMTFTSDGKRLITSGGEGIIKVWDVERIVRPPKP